MTALLRAATLALGAGLVLLGLALAAIPVIDTGHAPGTDAFRLIQFHCVLTGAAALLPVVWKRRDVFTAAPAMLALGLNAWLGVLAVMAGDPRLYWSLSLAAASAISLAYLFATDVMADEGSPGQDAAADEAGLVAPDFGVRPAQSSLGGALLSVGLIILSLAVVSAILFFGGIYCQLLKFALIDRREIELAALAENLSGGGASDFLLRAGATLGVTAVVYGAVFIVEAAISSGRRKRDREAQADFDRDLDRSERLYLRESLQALLRHIDDHEFGPGWRWLYAGGATALIAMMVAGPLAIVFGENFAMAALERDRASGSEALFYSDPFYIGGVIGGFFAGTLSIWSLYQLMGARRPDFGAYLYAMTGWNSLSSGPRSPDQFMTDLVRFVRGRRLDQRAAFDPAAFLGAAFRDHERVVYAATAWALLVTAIGSVADVARFRLVDREGVTFSNYFQVVRKRVALADIDHVKLECALLAPDDDGDIGFRIGYTIVEKGAFQIDLFHRWKKDPEYLNRLLDIDARLKASAVPAMRVESVGWAAKRRPGFIDGCANEIRARYDADLAPRLIRLLRADAAERAAP